MFLPSLLYWPSSLGKDAFMVLALGLCLNGAARLFTHRRGGFVVLGLGLAAALMVRPHVAAIAIAGLSVGFLLRPPSRRTSLTPIVRVGGLVLITVLAGFVTLRAATFLGIEEVSVSGVSDSIDEQSSRTSGGDSAFRPNPATNPANIPMAFVTVLFRPFPQEAHNSQTLLAAAEGLLALLLVARSWRQLLQVPRLLRREPYVALCLVFVVAFVIAFSSFSNFGILARERAQLWPVFLALLCVPLPVNARSSPRDVAARRHDVEPYQRARVTA